MQNIFTGFLLVFINFDLNFGNMKIGLVPDFLGYIFMIKGLDEMARESLLFSKARPYANFMIYYTGIMYILDFFGLSASYETIVYILSVLSAVISLYISYNIMMGVLDIEKNYNIFLDGHELKNAWVLKAVFSVLLYFLKNVEGPAVIIIFMSFIAAVYFLVVFYNSKKLYYSTVNKSY